MKKFLTSLLCVMMISCFMPTMAWAVTSASCAGGDGCTHAASITVGDTTTHYDTVADAVEVAKKGDTVVLLTNATASLTIDKEIILDLNEKILTADNASAVKINISSTETEEKSDDNSTDYQVTVKNGTLKCSLDGTSTVRVSKGKVLLDSVKIFNDKRSCVDNYGQLSLNKCTIEASNGGIWDFGVNSKIEMNGCDITAGYFGVYHNGSYAGFELSATDCKITSPDTTAVYISGSTTTTAAAGKNQQATFTRCTITGPTGIEGKYTDITLKDCTISATAEEPNFEQYNNGTTSGGFAVVSSDNSMSPNSPKPSAKVSINGGTYTGLIGLSQLISTEKYPDFTEAIYSITSGKFSSNPTAYTASDAKIYLNNDGIYQVNDATHTSIYNIWTVNNDGIYEESCYSAPTTTTTTTTPETTVTPGTDGNKETVTTSTSISASVSDTGVVEQEVDKDLADQIVASAVDNKATEVVIEVTTSTGNATSTSISLPAETIKTIAENTTANVTIKTDAAEITLDKKTTETIAKEAKGENIQLVVEKTKDEEGEMHFDLKITSDNKTIGNFQGGSVTVRVALNETLAVKDNLTSVYINDAGKYTKMGGQKNEDGTFSFNTGHFSTYAIMEEAEADAVIADQTAAANAKIKAGVKATTVTATAKATKGAITLTWTKSKGYKVDAYQVYRSTKKSGGYKLLTTTKKTTVKNTRGLKKGTRYYYKVRGIRTVDGKVVKTGFSKVVSRVAK